MKNKIGFIIVMCIVILIGLALIGFGIKSSIDTNNKTKDYISVEATFVGSDIYSSDEDGTTYNLKYEYIVDGQKYYVSTDYGTAVIPEEGSIKTIKYNPDNPSDAIITGFGSNVLVFVIGFMFASIPLVFIMTISDKRDNSSEKIRKVKSSLTSLIIGIIFAGVGVGFYYLMGNGSDNLSLISVFKGAGPLVIIPILFIVVGIYIILATFFTKKVKEVIVKVDSIIEWQDESYDIILADINIDTESLKTIMYKYYIYNTSKKEKFEIDKKFKVNIYKYGIMLEVVPVSQMIQARSLKQFVDEDFEEIF